MSDLLPCPFCGSKPYFGSDTEHWLICGDCSTVGPLGVDDQDAIEKWNTRSQPVCEWECVGISGLAINAPAGTKLYAKVTSDDA